MSLLTKLRRYIHITAFHFVLLRQSFFSLDVTAISLRTSNRQTLIQELPPETIELLSINEKSLTTNYDGERALNGNMFDIVVKEKPIVIDNFDVHSASNAILSYMVWMREGSYMTHELSSTNWYVVGCGEAQGYGISFPTSLNPINEVLLDPSSVMGLYITFRRKNDETIDGYMIYGVGTQSGSVHVQNENLQVLVGTANSYLFGVYFNHRIWNGSIYYRVLSEEALGDASSALRKMQIESITCDRPTTFPSMRPSPLPSTSPTNFPSYFPTDISTQIPSHHPTNDPTFIPSHSPTNDTTSIPSDFPTYDPTNIPSYNPTKYPTGKPSISHTYHPTQRSSYYPTQTPTQLPSYSPTYRPTQLPSYYPTKTPTQFPSYSLTYYPTQLPSYYPTKTPTQFPVYSPTYHLTPLPSYYPTKVPSQLPSYSPTYYPTQLPSYYPSKVPSQSPLNSPTYYPTQLPSYYPTKIPTSHQTKNPTKSPINSPTYNSMQIPSRYPTKFPAPLPSYTPTVFHASFPSRYPTYHPTLMLLYTPSNGSTNVALGDPTDDLIEISPTYPTNNPSFSIYNTTLLSIIPTDFPTYIPSYNVSKPPSDLEEFVQVGAGVIGAVAAAAASAAAASSSASASESTTTESSSTLTPERRGRLHLANLDLGSEKAEFMDIWEIRRLIVKQKRDCEEALNDCLTENELCEGMQNGCIEDRFLMCSQTSNAIIITSLSSNGRDRIQLSVSEEFLEDEYISSSVVDVEAEPMSTRYDIVG